jgi:Family of unknown function (DUF5690)
MFPAETRITRWLSRAPTGVLNAYAMAAAFTTYFCMYAFRKPFTAATYHDLFVGGTQIELKTAFVISQLIGYAASKYIGIKLCSEMSRARRAWSLVLLVAGAELALVLFAVVPAEWKIAAIFFNGLPLGMVWGLVVLYLEGRQTSDMLLAALACSFIVSSGVVKDVGRALMAGDPIRIYGLPLPNPFPAVSEFWMPAATGLLFAPVFLLAVWLLNQVPEPTPADQAARTRRVPMNAARRHQFVLAYLPGIVPLIAAYVALTAFRDFRDNYMVEVLSQLGYQYEQNRDIMSRMELGVGFGVMLVTALLFLIKDNRRGLFAAFLAMIGGMLAVGGATVLLRAEMINGFWWMMLIGLGSYLAYVPYNTVLFERLMASTQFVGTAVFAIYLADSIGYTGSVAVQVGRDIAVGTATRLAFLEEFAIVLSLFGTVSLVAAWIYFSKFAGAVAEADAQVVLDQLVEPA